MLRRILVLLRGYNRRFAAARALAERTASSEHPNKTIEGSGVVEVDEEAVVIAVYLVNSSHPFRRGQPDAVTYRVMRGSGSIERVPGGKHGFQGTK